MTRYWIMAPFESKSAEQFEAVWRFDLTHGLVSIGWSNLGNISEMSREELSAVIEEKFPDKPQQTKGLYGNMLWSFYHEIQPGDLIVARRGRKVLAAIGQVVESAKYEPGRNPDIGHPGFLKVSWQDQPRDKVFPGIVFPMHTLTETTSENLRILVEGAGVQSEPVEAKAEIEDPSAFVLEKYLEDFIVSNFQTIFKGDLQIYEDADGNNGQQYSTDIGSIDILAKETRSDSFVVIELKKGRPSDQVVGQVLRYMGWVKKNLCTGNQAVSGLVICKDEDAKLSYALEMTSNINVRYYSVSFKLKDAP